MALSRRVHKVGLTAVAVGLPCLLLLSFADVRANRVADGTGLSLARSASLPEIGLLLGLWLVVCGLSLRGRRSAWDGLARGLTASAIVVAVVAVSGTVATRLATSLGPFTRVSIGGGAWIAMAAAWLLVVASRREAEPLGGWTSAIMFVVPVGVVVLLWAGRLANTGVMREYANVKDRFWIEAVNHATVAASCLAVALVLGLGLGVLAFTYKALSGPVLGGVSVIQTIPGLAMIGILVAPLSSVSQRYPVLQSLGIGGIGWAPVAVALVLYALLVIVHNTMAGLHAVPRETTEAARAMGMSGGQILRKVRLPIASPVVYTGGRTASLQTVGNATLGAFVGGWTLGRFVFQGMAEGSNDLVLLGALGIVVLALIFDAVARLVEPWVVPALRRRRAVRS